MTFQDVFTSRFLENMVSTSLVDAALAMVLAFLLGLFIFFIYKRTYSGVMYSASFGASLIALALITTLVILAVSSNVILSLGMVGALVVVALFIALLYSGMRIANAASTAFGTMVAGSCTIMLVFQAFLNIGCVVGLLPTTGKPLPFISSGGSSLIATFIMVGLILSVSKEAGGPSIYEQRRANLRVVRAADPDEPSRAAKPGLLGRR